MDDFQRVGKKDVFAGAFMIDAFQMIKVFCKPRIKVGTEWVIKGQTCDQVRNHIFMMRKALMGSLGDNQFGRYIFRYISLIFNFILYISFLILICYITTRVLNDLLDV